MDNYKYNNNKKFNYHPYRRPFKYRSPKFSNIEPSQPSLFNNRSSSRSYDNKTYDINSPPLKDSKVKQHQLNDNNSSNEFKSTQPKYCNSLDDLVDGTININQSSNYNKNTQREGSNIYSYTNQELIDNKIIINLDINQIKVSNYCKTFNDINMDSGSGHGNGSGNSNKNENINIKDDQEINNINCPSIINFKTIPSINELSRMSDKKLKSLNGFYIENENGSIYLPGIVNVFKLNLNSIVQINKYEINIEWEYFYK